MSEPQPLPEIREERIREWGKKFIDFIFDETKGFPLNPRGWIGGEHAQDLMFALLDAFAVFACGFNADRTKEDVQWLHECLDATLIRMRQIVGPKPTSEDMKKSGEFDVQ